MDRTAALTVEIDLGRVRANAAAVRQSTGVAVLAVVKADAYGLGATEVAAAVADVVDGFYVFDAAEAIDARLARWPDKRVVALSGTWTNSGDYLAAGVRPVVWDVDRAATLRAARPVVSVDTGQQRFAVAPEMAEAVRKACDCGEVMTHAIRADQVTAFRSVTDGWGAMIRHAAGTALLRDPMARMDAVRPGLALYRGAVSVHTPLVDVRESRGPAGYSGFMARRFGIILVGYRNGMRVGPCDLNGIRRQVVEVGMQSAFVELGPHDRVGDRVEWADVPAIADAWKASEQQVLVGLTSAGVRHYRHSG